MPKYMYRYDNIMLYVQEIMKNLVFRWLLNKHIFCLVFESNKLVLNKKGMFIGKGYSDGGILKFHVMANIANINVIITLLLTCLSLLMCSMLDLDMLILTH